MELSYAQPADRGVTTLMYVGDDNAVDQALAPAPHGEVVVGVLAAVVALNSTGGTRLVAAGLLGLIVVVRLRDRLAS